MKPALLALVIAGCGNPPLTITLVLDTSASSECAPAATCEDIPLACEPYASIRIIDPDQPKSPYVSICQPILLDHKADLCSLDTVQLTAGVTVPSQSLQVEVVLYAKNDLSTDMRTGEPICPTDVEFTEETGFPVEGTPPPVDEPPNRPAIGGRGFYHPGDSETVVKLGCPDLSLISPGCDSKLTAVQATATDFDTRAFVSGMTADNLSVSVGEPMGTADGFTFDAISAPMLQRTPDDTPTWAESVVEVFASTACVQILDQGTGETTPTLTCLPAPMPGSMLNVAAIRLAKASLDQILTTIGKPSFPDAGLVVGLVLDSDGQPKAGVTAVPTDGTTHVQYLSADRKSLVTGMTSTSGVFVSQDAPYSAIAFSASNGSVVLPAQAGGLVIGKVTIVLFQFN